MPSIFIWHKMHNLKKKKKKIYGNVRDKPWGLIQVWKNDFF